MWTFCFSASYLGRLKEWLLARRLESPSCHAQLVCPQVGPSVDCFQKGRRGGPLASCSRVPVLSTCPWENMDDFSGPWMSLSPLILFTSWSSITGLDVFISDFRNHIQMGLAVLIRYTKNNWTFLCCFQLANFLHPCKHCERFLYILNLLSISPPKCAF